MLHYGISALGALLAAGLGLNQAGVTSDSSYTQEIQKWRAQRVERLTKPGGWLTLVGLDWLKNGKNKLGSAKDNDIVIATAPAYLGTITLTGGKAAIALDPQAGATVDGAKKLGAELLDDTHEKPTTIAFGTTSFYLIKREDKVGLRIRDTEAPTRKHFAGIDNFEIDPSWRIEAKWEAYNPPHEVEESNIIGQIDKVIVPGAAVFQRDGKTYRVEPVIETPGDTELFLVFSDKTSGKETYGAARFVYTEAPKDGKVILDFNKAYNPPCAFTPFATCPLPTAQNRLQTRVTAGEKKYRLGHE
jgi:uncharacterized protein (DUF1684 family)